MRKNIVAVVGRPNVGKSTLFNKLAGRKISIVENTPGVTRDRIYADCTWLNHNFTVIDTGGLEPDTKSPIMKLMFNQAVVAMETADVILFVVDIKQGITDADELVAKILRKSKKPVLLMANKTDTFSKDSVNAYEFYNLALGEVYPISAEHGLGIGDALDALVDLFEYDDNEEIDESLIKVAVIGRPNAGKSSLINRLLGEERVIVSPVPGTTRDAIDTKVTINGDDYLFIDTAGIRRKSKITESIEKYSIVRAVSAIERADTAVLMIDAAEGLAEQDAKIAGIAHERGKGIVLAVNKWDLIEKDDKTLQKFTDGIRNDLSYLNYAPVEFISALTGQRLDKLIGTIKAVSENHAKRVQTGVLNDVLIDALAMNQPPAVKGKQLKVYYTAQVSVKPPAFTLFVNKKDLLHFSYKRYIENKIREAFGFVGTPIHFIVKEKTKFEKG
jgi:GTP-binding protein